MDNILEKNEFEESYSKIKEVQENIKKILESLVNEYDDLKKQEKIIMNQFIELSNMSDIHNSDNNFINYQTSMLSKSKLLKEFKQMQTQNRYKQSMVLRNIQEISKSQVIQPKQMQDIINMKKRLELDQTIHTNKTESNISISGLTIQDIIRIGEELAIKK